MKRLLKTFVFLCGFGFLGTFAAEPETMRANNGQIIGPGTSKLDVMKWQGEPEMKDANEYKNSETWYYTRDGGTYLLYFSGPKVVRIEFQR